MDDTLDTEPLESMDEDTDSKEPQSKFEAVQDDMTSEEILEQVQNASCEAAEKLTLKKPLGFLRQRGDGTTTLSFLTGCEGNDPSLKEKPVSLGLLTGKLTQGSAMLHNFRDDKRSMAKPSM
nr:bromodomain-containing protein 7-like isoform X2 [Cherax quadricarinatus]